MNGLHRIKASKETFAKFHGWNTDEITYGRLGSIAFGQITSEILYWCSLHNEIRSYTHIDGPLASKKGLDGASLKHKLDHIALL